MPKYRLSRTLLPFFVALVMTLAPESNTQEAHVQVQYTVTDLGTVPGCDVTYATAVNDDGWVAGYAYTHVPPGHGDEMLSHPFVWHKGVLTPLATLGGEFGKALAVNSRGDAAGFAEAPKSAEKPVIWRRAENFAPSPLSEGAGGVNCLLDDNMAAGYIYPKGVVRAAVWQGNTARMPGNPHDAESRCNWVNSKGTAVGLVIPEGGHTPNMREPGDRHAAMWRDGREMRLPELGGATSECEAINEADVAVGWSDTKDGRKACLWNAGTVHVLGSPEGYESEAHSINRRGDIVGEMHRRAGKGGMEGACIWRNGAAEDLNRLIPADSGWTLSVAKQISNNGLIVGIGSYAKYPDHYWRAFLLTPIRRQSLLSRRLPAR